MGWRMPGTSADTSRVPSIEPVSVRKPCNTPSTLTNLLPRLYKSASFRAFNLGVTSRVADAIFAFRNLGKNDSIQGTHHGPAHGYPRD